MAVKKRKTSKLEISEKSKPSFIQIILNLFRRFLTATPKRTQLVQIVVGSFLIAALTLLLNKLLFGNGRMTFWILLEFGLQSLVALTVFAFCRSTRRVLFFQFVTFTVFFSLNSIKMHFRSTPLLPADFLLVRETFQIIPRYEAVFISIGIGLPLLISLVLCLKSCSLPKGWEWLMPVPFFSGLLVLICFPGPFYRSFDSLLHNQDFNIPVLIKEKGDTIGASLTFSIEVARFLEVIRFSPSQEVVSSSVAWLKANSLPRAELEPISHSNVYVILTESFWDPSVVSQIEGVTYLAPEFKEIWDKAGKQFLLSPFFGGGTANVEFELLCGLPSRMVTKAMIFQVALSNSIPCLPQVLKETGGYKSFAFHPYDPGFYNRSVAYPLLGFDKFFSIGDFHNSPGEETFKIDRDFIKESIAQARSEAKGAPFLAYMMTFAGHWPFHWVSAYSKKIHLDDSDREPVKAEVERHLNINYITSEVLADAAQSILREDPSALIVIAGDHQPGLAQRLVNDHTQGEDLVASRFYLTPLWILGPNAGQKPGMGEDRMAAFEISNEILDRLGVQDSLRHHFPLMRRPSGHLMRPLQNGALLLSREKLDLVCDEGSVDVECRQALEWFKQGRNLASDLTHGSQFGLGTSVK